MKQNSIEYSISGIAEREFAVSYELRPEEIDLSRLSVMVNTAFDTNYEDNELKITFRANYILDNSTESPLARIAVTATFKVMPLSDLINVDSEGKISSHHPDLLDCLIMTTVGAARGILYVRLKGSPLDGLVLPMIPIETFHN